MSVIVFTGSFILPKQTHAIGVVGSNAVKSAVINSLESVGVKFTNKEAKEKAFEAWNMKAYEKWKADEAAGRNADLWAHFESVQTQIASAPVQSIPDKPNFGKMLLDATWFGMAISIGAEIGYAIEDAQAYNRMIDYMSTHKQEFINAESFNANFGFYNEHKINNARPSLKYEVYLKGPYPASNGNSYYAFSSSGVEGGAFINVTSWSKYDAGSYRFRYTANDGFKHYFDLSIDRVKPVLDDAIIYSATPKIDHVPKIVPNPYVEPLLVPKPDISVVPSILPKEKPVPVVVPIGDDPFVDNPYIEPYAPPATEPIKPPVKPPVTTPGLDPIKKPIPEIIPEPGVIKDPIEQPKEVKPENLSCERVQKPDFEPLGNAFTTSFPFSLPWDLKRYLDASFSGIGSEKPKFPLPFFGDEVQITIPDALDKYVGFFKGFLLIVFDVGIIYLFVRVMRGGSD